MNLIKVVAISSKRDIKSYVRFKNNLYRGNKYAVPTLEMDEIATLNPKKNPASDFCEWQCYLAYNEKGDIVGRITAIINNNANKTWNKKEGRFGFFDFIEDIDVAVRYYIPLKSGLKSVGWMPFMDLLALPILMKREC